MYSDLAEADRNCFIDIVVDNSNHVRSANTEDIFKRIDEFMDKEGRQG